MSLKQNAIIIKKYPNRRLYNTNTSDYITLSDVRKLVLDSIEFEVIDSKTGADLTRLTLAQIIFEQENTGSYLLNSEFLKQLIIYYDDNLCNILPTYLDLTMKNFYQQQDAMRKISEKTLDTLSPVSLLEKISQNNINIFEKTMQMLFK